MKSSFLQYLLEKTSCFSHKKTCCSSWFTSFFLSFIDSLFVLWSQWHGHRSRVIRCSKPSHSFSCFFFFSCFHWFLLFFYNSVFRFFCVLCSFFVILVFPSLCFVSSVSFFLIVFFTPFSKLFLFQLFFSDLLLLFCSSLKSSFSNFLFCDEFFNSFVKTCHSFCFSLVSCSFSVLFCLLSRFCSPVVVYILFVNVILSESSAFKSVSFPSFFDSLFWSVLSSLFRVLFLVHHFFFLPQNFSLFFIPFVCLFVSF